ncbi:MAG: hypothetical protein C4523_15245 [Myxococcales bacterium]|nr:MAG: hypothetical protein C4523_15245 [Myxococcales bacterium]
MRKTWVTAIVLVIVACGLSQTAWAQSEKEKAKAQLAEMDKTMAFVKSTIIPLINCYAQHQPHLQFLDGAFPDKGREHVTAMDYCTSAYPDQLASEPKLMDLKSRASSLLKTDTDLGRQYIDAWDEYNRLAGDPSKKLKPAEQQMAATQKAKLEQMKQELYQHASQFKDIQTEYKTFNTEFVNKYKELQLKAAGK